MQATLREILLVGTGGFAGSAIRFLVSAAMIPASAAHGLPVGTFAVNAAGSLLIGLFMAFSGNNALMLLLVTGFCGGFTTFSAFSMETLSMLRAGQVWTGAGYAVASVVVCVVMALAGLYAGERIR